MEILDGKLVAQKIKTSLKNQVDADREKGFRPPHLVAILIGNNGASETYVASKVKNCEEIGFKSTLIRKDNDIEESDLLDIISTLNKQDDVDGILVQLPLPSHIKEANIINAIDPSKDVDGFSPYNMGLLTLGLPCYIPATPYGILLMLEHYQIATSGKKVTVLGRSNIVGRPISILLSQAPYNCTVTVMHSRSNNIAAATRDADIIIAAIGQPGYVTEDMVADNAIVIDVGITRVPDASKKSGFAIKGDVDFDKVSVKCSHITPVPGGVGLMTIGALLKNTYQSYQNRINQ